MLSFDEMILKDIRNALDMSSSLFPSKEDIRKYWEEHLNAEEKEEQIEP